MSAIRSTIGNEVEIIAHLCGQLTKHDVVLCLFEDFFPLRSSGINQVHSIGVFLARGRMRNQCVSGNFPRPNVDCGVSRKACFHDTFFMNLGKVELIGTIADFGRYHARASCLFSCNYSKTPENNAKQSAGGGQTVVRGSGSEPVSFDWPNYMHDGLIILPNATQLAPIKLTSTEHGYSDDGCDWARRRSNLPFGVNSTAQSQACL